MSSFATSYIPTVASTVTRAADIASMTGSNFSSWYNQSQGSFYAENDGIYNNIGTSFVYELWNDSFGSYSQGTLFVNNGAPYLSGGGGLSINGGVITAGSTNKYISSMVQGGNAVFVVNGVVKGTILATLRSSTPTVLYIGADPNSGFGSMMNGHIRKLSYYPVALSSSNLVALTS